MWWIMIGQGLLCSIATTHAEPTGAVLCEVRENGKLASGTLIVKSGAAEVAHGTCGAPLVVPAGAYTALVRLDGALDGPERVQEVTVQPSQTRKVAVSFETGVLEVRIFSGGRRAAGLATLMRDGRTVGTLASGVSGHLTTGSYTVTVKYRAEEQRFEGVRVEAGQNRLLEANF